MRGLKNTYPLLIRCCALVLSLLCAAAPAVAEATKTYMGPQTLAELQVAIEKLRVESGLSGLGVALVDSSGPIWVAGLGEADTASHQPVTQDTLFRIGSTSKMFVALAVLQFIEQGKLALDDKLSELAPEIYFENPWEQTNPIRLVHLLEHTTGWSDIGFSVYAQQDAHISLEAALAFHPQYRQSRWVPGTRYAYNNAGPAVVAYILQKLTGQLYEDYVQEQLFKPLGMTSATFFESDLYKKNGVTLYSGNGRALDYWNFILRPAGSINASTADMAKFLHFLIARGEVNQQRLLSEQSFARMETPTSTLGAKAGTQAGYGLYNYVSGFEQANVAFRGHDGDLPGGHCRLSYVPELNLGYVFMVNQDNAQAINKLQTLIRAYLLRGVSKKDQPAIELPEKFKQLSGYYIPIALRSDSLRLISELMGVMHIRVSDNQLHRMPLFGGWAAPSNDYAVDENLLVSAHNGLASIAMVNDPLAGEVLEVSSDLMGPTLKRVSAVRIFGLLGLLVCTLVLSLASLLFAPIWLLRWVRGRRLGAAAVSIRLWPLVTSITPILGGGMVAVFGSFASMGVVSAATLAVFICSCLYPLLAAYSVFNSYRLRSAQINLLVFWHSALLSLCHLGLVVVLAYYDMLMLRLWV